MTSPRAISSSPPMPSSSNVIYQTQNPTNPTIAPNPNTAAPRPGEYDYAQPMLVATDFYSEHFHNVHPDYAALKIFINKAVGNREAELLAAVQDKPTLRMFLPILFDAIKTAQLQSRFANHLFTILCEQGLEEMLAPIRDVPRLAEVSPSPTPQQPSSSNANPTTPTQPPVRNIEENETVRGLVTDLFQTFLNHDRSSARNVIGPTTSRPSRMQRTPTTPLQRIPPPIIPGRLARRSGGDRLTQTPGGVNRGPRPTRRTSNEGRFPSLPPTYSESTNRPTRRIRPPTYPTHMRNSRCFHCDEMGHFREWCPQWRCIICNQYAPRHTLRECPNQPTTTSQEEERDDDFYDPGYDDFDDDAMHNLNT